MKRELQGYYVTVSTVGEKVNAFVPYPLPPKPPVEWSSKLREKYDQALIELGRLDSASLLLPDSMLFLYSHIRKEAVLSSMIEGTQSSISDLLLYELEQLPGVPVDDVREVSNYVAALNHGITRLLEGFPLSLRLLKEIHGILLAKGRGSNQTPGEFRRSQNWIGGTRPGNAKFVPPPPESILECMGALELFLHNKPEHSPVLLKAALAHVQFETIHPFLDGNGRLGRLLITLLLCEQKVLKNPMLYLSLYFKTHRQYYYDLLNSVRVTGDWESWLEFFAEAVIFTANQAVDTIRELHELSKADHEKISSLGRAAASTLIIHRVLLERPIVKTGWLVEKTGISHATINKCLNHLKDLDIISELTGRRRDRIFSYTRFIEILNYGLELSD
jgi:Fic family protein